MEMKRIYLLIMTAMLCFAIFPASAQDSSGDSVRFTVKIPSSEVLRCTVNYQPYELKRGTNQFDVPQYANIIFESISPWRISSITNKNQTAVDGLFGGIWYLNASPSIQDEEYTIIVVNTDEYRTSEFTVNVDDASLVTAILSGYDTQINLADGENIVKFDPAMETYLMLTPVNYNVPFYSVKINGTEVAPQGETYNVPLSEDCVVDITATLPDEDRTVSFSYAEGSEGSVSISVNDKEVPGFDGKSITVKLGDRITIKGNTTLYSYELVTVDGEDVSFFSSYTFTVMKNSDVYVKARAYDIITATVIVTDPSLITVYRGYDSNDVIPLNAGTNVLEFPENKSTISWTVDDMAILNTIKLNGDSIHAYSCKLLEGDVIEFDVTEKIFDKEAVVWVDNVAGKASSMFLRVGSTTDQTAQFSLSNGYNFISFYEGMNPFTVEWFGRDSEIPNVNLTGQAYLNGELLEPQYNESSSYSIDLSEGDVIKLFMDAAPVECNVDFKIAEGIEASVVRDIIVPISDRDEVLKCFAGTQISISGQAIEVYVNGTAIERGTTGEGPAEYTFTVTDPETSVTVANIGGSVASTAVSHSDSIVYNLQGLKVGTKYDLKNLPVGLYILNGEKISVSR